jgi:hypothetical protein
MKPIRRLRDALRSFARASANAMIGNPLFNRYPRFGHFSYKVLPVTFLVNNAVIWAPTNGWWNVFEGVFGVAILPPMVLGMFHGDFLCTQCAQEFPLDATAEAEARKAQFRIYHFGRRRFVIPWLSAIVLSAFATHNVYEKAIWTLLMLSVPLWFWRYSHPHQRLQVWCPFCRHNRPPDDGEDVPIPDPDPSVKVPA